jgi:hypothetical protein
MSRFTVHARGRALALPAAVAAAAALGLAGCGGSPTSSAVGTSSSGAAAASSPAATASSPAATASAAGKPAATSMADLSTRITAAAKAKGTARLVSETTGPAAKRSTGVQRFGRSGLEFSVTTSVSGRTIKMIYVRRAAYMNLGEKFQGKSWVRIAPEGTDPLSKALAPVLTQLSTSLEVGSQVANVKGSTIRDVTRTELGGRPVTKYTVVQSAQAFMTQLDKLATTPQLRAELRRQFKGAHSETQIWLTDDDLLVRNETRVVGGSAPSATSTVTYSDWGKPVTISAPPRRDVVDLGA